MVSIQEEQLVSHGFGPVYDARSRILILGSFPSVKSREQQFYYGHPQNRFWKVLAALTGAEIEAAADIAVKKRFLEDYGIALYDVIESCRITGSSDASIRDVTPADLTPILEAGNIEERIYANGTMKVMSQSEYTADELVGQGVWQALAFGPGLVENGSVTVSENDEVGKAMASNPRTAIGIVSENHYLFVVSDGRTSESAGLSLYQLAQFMKSLGAETAYNLDGGGSSTMYFNGQVINNPTTSGRIKERGVSDIVYIG